ncbi:unnamed protein product [Aureobasidium pullulans]|uniref:REJ domain-containing protein n=1 Tax=Aureobasidium pullulans TaxID=5580 RepID=A0A4S8XTU5_AURPU|nr:hypothetical protein D6D22_04104 [Aureobasidium pullulans]CAC9893724.1 unnamed protein product [Aureobasidium pullulans]
MKIFTILSIVVAMASAATIPTNTPDISTSDLSTFTSASSSASNFASKTSFPVQDPDDDGVEWLSFSYSSSSSSSSSSSASSAPSFSSSASSITSDPKKSSNVKVTRISKFTTKIAGWFRRI